MIYNMRTLFCQTTENWQATDDGNSRMSVTTPRTSAAIQYRPRSPALLASHKLANLRIHFAPTITPLQKQTLMRSVRVLVEAFEAANLSY